MRKGPGSECHGKFVYLCVCVCVCVCVFHVWLLYVQMYTWPIFHSIWPPHALKPGSESWGQNLKKQVLFTFLAVALHFSPCCVLALFPSFLLPPHFISPFSIASYFLPFVFTFPWTKPLGSCPGICFCLPTIGECNVKTFFMKLGETLQLEWSSMVCTFCGSLNT